MSEAKPPKVELEILKQAWCPSEEPERFRNFLTEIAPSLTLGTLSQKVLKAFSRKDIKALEVAGFLSRNPYYEFQFLKFIESLGRKDEPSPEAAVVLLGMQNTRNFILAMQMMRTVYGTHPEWDDNGKLALQPKDALKYFIPTDDLLHEKGYEEFMEIGFAASLLFDYVHTIAVKKEADQKVIDHIGFVFKQGTRAAKISKELVAQMPDFTYKKYLFGASLMHMLGQAVIAMQEVTYLNFDEEARKKEIPNSVWPYAEEKRFGISYPVVNAMMCRVFASLKPLELAMLFVQNPGVLKSIDKKLYQLSAALHLVTNMTRHFKKIEGDKDPVLVKWKTPAIEDFPIAGSKLAAVTAKIEI